MQEPNVTFLKQLLSTPAPSGAEAPAAQVWRNEARTFADEVYADVQGNSYAVLHGNGVRILLAGHIDEIGIMISHIDDEGYLYFQTIGGWDAQVFVGQRVLLLGATGEVCGVIGKKPIHLLKTEERDVASKVDTLWIDIGVQNRSEAEAQVQVGTVGVLDAPIKEFPHGRIVSRSIDNRIGAFTVLETLRLLAQDRPSATVAAVATTGEETTFAGATAAAYRFEAHLAIAVDVTYATDHPDSNKRKDGDVRLGGGPVLARGAANMPLVYARLLSLAQEHSIPYTLQITPRYTGTDADAMQIVRGGIATGVVSIPNRYMHSPNEMIQLSDVAHAAQLIATFVRSVQHLDEFIPH